MARWNPETGQYEEDYIDPVTGDAALRPYDPAQDPLANTSSLPAQPGVSGLPASTVPPPAPSPTPPPAQTPTPAPPPFNLPPVTQPRGDNQPQQGTSSNYFNLFDQLMQRFQPQQPQGMNPEIVRLLQAQEARTAADAQKRAAFEESVRAQLLGLIQRGQEPIDADAIAQGPEAKAFARVRERALQRYRAQQAEQRAAQGLGQTQRGEVSGALQSDIATGESELAENIAAFESRLIADQITQRRQQLMQALQMGAGILGQDQEQAIRRELAQLEVALKRELGQADIGLRGFLGGGQLSLGLLQSLMGNQQFYDRLGFDVGVHQSDLNRRGVEDLFF